MTDNIFAFAQARATSRAELVNGWLLEGTLKIYSGTRPATPDTAIVSQVLLCTLTFPDPAGVVTNGIWTAGSITPVMIAETGTATWARSGDSTGAVIADADIGAPSSGAMIELSAVNLVQGAYVSVVSFTLTEG